MKRRGLQLSRPMRLTLYATCMSLFFSGAIWAWIHHLDDTGKADDNWVRLKQPLIAIHGFSAMVFMLLLGAIIISHVRRAWHAHKNRNNGVPFLIAVGLLCLSGYLLYYLGDEDWRSKMSQFHLWLGTFSPVLLLWHIMAGRKATK